MVSSVQFNHLLLSFSYLFLVPLIESKVINHTIFYQLLKKLERIIFYIGRFIFSAHPRFLILIVFYDVFEIQSSFLCIYAEFHHARTVTSKHSCNTKKSWPNETIGYEEIAVQLL
ncbi:hypothetical protein AHAS_Ahas14G0064100 [Arachis hypogaea]